MNKLREKFVNTLLEVDKIDGTECEQITDDFSVKLLIWLNRLKKGQLSSEIDFTKSEEEVSEQLQQYFKDNIYGKE